MLTRVEKRAAKKGIMISRGYGPVWGAGGRF